MGQISEGEYTEGAIMDLAAPSLFQEPRLIEVQSPPESALAELRLFVDSAVPDVFVWVRTAGPAPLVTKAKREFDGQAQFVTCEEPKGESARLAFAKTELESAGKQITPDGLRMLVTSFALDLAELAGACSQLAAQPQQKLDRDLIEQTFGGRVETTVFKIADAAFGGSSGEAIKLLRHALNTGADPVMMLGACASRVRQMGKLISNPRLSAESLGIQPWMLDRVRKDLTGWSELELAKLVRRVSDADAAVKGASRDPEFVLENLLLAIAIRRA